jgi:hypothetical protein
MAQRGAKRESGIKAHLRIEEFQRKKNSGMWPRSNVSIAKNWDILPKITRR